MRALSGIPGHQTRLSPTEECDAQSYLTGQSWLCNYLSDYRKGEGEFVLEDVGDILHKNRTKHGGAHTIQPQARGLFGDKARLHQYERTQKIVVRAGISHFQH